MSDAVGGLCWPAGDLNPDWAPNTSTQRGAEVQTSRRSGDGASFSRAWALVEAPAAVESLIGAPSADWARERGRSSVLIGLRHLDQHVGRVDERVDLRGEARDQSRLWLRSRGTSPGR
jgi:hypothetical protein